MVLLFALSWVLFLTRTYQKALIVFIPDVLGEAQPQLVDLNQQGLVDVMAQLR